MTKKKVLLAFSGGLDTSFSVKYLMHDLHFEVYSAIVNTGGFSAVELQEIEQKALNLGVKHHTALEQTEVFYDKILKYLLFGNVLKNNTYPLSVSAERTVQAVALANYAKELKVDAIAHGSTAAGNDQIRFDSVFQLLIPEIEIITPIRDLRISRQDEIAYLQKHKVELPWEKAKYSINKGIWGTSVGGQETLTSHQTLPEGAYPNQLTETSLLNINIEFKKGEPVALNGQQMKPTELIAELNTIAGKYAIGRDMHIGDTIIGIKGRVGFEAPAPLVLIKAHHTLEKHTLSKWQLYWKEQLANWYGMFIHESQYFEPVMRDIESFLTSSQQKVSGKVFIALYPYRFVVNGIDSPYDLMNSEFGDYGEVNKKWDGQDVKGFTKIFNLSQQIFNSKDKNV